jgi:hypothetical protein
MKGNDGQNLERCFDVVVLGCHEGYSLSAYCTVT